MLIILKSASAESSFSETIETERILQNAYERVSFLGGEHEDPFQYGSAHWNVEVSDSDEDPDYNDVLHDLSIRFPESEFLVYIQFPEEILFLRYKNGESWFSQVTVPTSWFRRSQ